MSGLWGVESGQGRDDERGFHQRRGVHSGRRLPCSSFLRHEVATSGRRLGSAPPGLRWSSDRLLVARDCRLTGPSCGPWRRWLTCATSGSVSHALSAGQSGRRLQSTPARAASSRVTRANRACMGAAGQAAGAAELRAEISAAMAELCSVFSDYDPVTAAAYINDKLLVSPIGGDYEAALGDGGS
jgi:hypothetical protein